MEKKSAGMVSFVLLREPQWNQEAFVQRMKARWNLQLQEVREDVIFFESQGRMISVAYMPAPVPNQEAEQNAACNFLWREAVTETAKHQAHLIVMVFPQKTSKLESAKDLVRTAACALADENAIGLYANGTVYQPEFYLHCAEALDEGELPVLNLVWIGISRDSESTFRGYTIGLDTFGHRELEVLDVRDAASNLLDFLYGIVNYLLESGAVLEDGQTIGFSAEQKLAITLSPGVEFDFDTLKIQYPAD